MVAVHGLAGSAAVIVDRTDHQQRQRQALRAAIADGREPVHPAAGRQIRLRIVHRVHPQIGRQVHATLAGIGRLRLHGVIAPDLVRAVRTVDATVALGIASHAAAVRTADGRGARCDGAAPAGPLVGAVRTVD